MRRLLCGLEKINAVLQKAEKFVGAVSLAVLFVVMIVNAILRYLFRSGLPWSDELNQFLLVWLGFLAASYAMSTDSHLSITAIVNCLPKWLQYLLRECMNAVQIYMFVIYLPPLFRLMCRLPISNVMRIPLKYVYVILPVSFALMIYHIVVNMVRDSISFMDARKGEVK